jgi:WD40 repeat protein
VVRAGLIPALRRGAIEGSERWLVTDMLPGGFPFDELASALLRVAVEAPADLDEQLRRDERGLVRVAKRLLPPGSQLLLIVDQFEELFTLTASDEHRSAFLSMLAATVADERSHIRIVVTMRADYFDRPLRFAELGDALRAGTVPIPAPTEPELSAMVEEPARGVGVSFESGLVERIVADVKGQPGALPLLEFAMTELFDARQSDVLQGHAYGTSGGVLGALGRRAESIHLELDEEGRTVARQMFLRLVNVVESGRDTRRRVRIVELRRLGFPEELLDSVLESFGEHRLLTFDQDPVTRGPTVEVAHEALFAEWDRLNTWISEQREDLLLRSRLAEALAEWESAERAESYLLTGGRLTQHEAWTSATELSLTTAEREFLAQSRMREDQLSTQRRRVRRLVMSGFGVAALVALLLAVVAVAARDDAREQAALAYGRELAASAIGVVDDDPELATLLAIEAFDVAPEGTELFPEAMIALRQAMDTNRLVARVQTTRGVGVAFSADDALLVVDSGERSVSRYEIESGRIAPDPVWVYQDLATIDFFEDVVVHPRGDFAAVVITDRDFGGEPGNGVDLDSERSDGKMGRVVLIDPATGAFLGEVPMAVCEQAEFGPWWFSSDGSLFGIGLVGFDQTADGCGPQIVRGAFTIFHTETWTEIARFADARVTMTNDMSRVLVDELEFASDARTVASLLSWPSLDPVDTFDIAGDVSIAPDGRTLVYRLPNEIETRPGFWDVETNRHLAWGDGAGGFSGSMGPFTPDGAVLIASTKDDTLYDPRTGLAWLTLPTSFTTGLALSIDGRYAATAGPAGVELWDLSYRSDATSLTDSPAGIAWINSDAFEEGPRTVLRGFWCTALRTPEGCEPLQPRVVVIDPDTGRVIAHRDARLNSSQLPDGRIVIVPVTGNDIDTYRDDILGPPTIWDPASGDEVTLQDCHAPLAEYFSHPDEGGLGERGYTCPGGDFFFGHSVVASADGRFVAALGHDPSTAPPPDPNTPVSHTEVLLRVWDTTTLQALATHKVALDCCLGNHTITYLGDGWVTLIDGEAGSSSQSVVYKIIGVETGDVIARLQTEASWRESIAVSTEETMLYLVDEGGDVFEFDTETWTQVRRWPAMEGRPRGLSLSRDDRFLAVGGEDGLISIWDLSSEEPVLVDRIPIGGWVSDTVWLEDGRLGVAVKPPGLRAEWWVVDVAPAAVLARARDASLRDFTPTECRTYNIERCAKG